MIVKIKPQVHRDAELDYGHLKNISFEVANPFDSEWVELKNGNGTISVLWDDVEITEGRKPTEEEIEYKCWLCVYHIPHYSIPYNPVEDEN